MHGFLKDEIKEAKYVSLIEVYEALFQRYSGGDTGTHATAEGMEKEFKDILLKANQSQQKAGGWNDSKEPLNSYKLPENPPVDP